MKLKDDLWYVWLVLSWVSDEKWGIKAVCSSRAKAGDLADPGDFITIMALNEKATGVYEFQGEWVEDKPGDTP